MTTTARRRALVAAAVVAGAVEAVLARRTALPEGILDREQVLLAEIGGMWLAFAVAVWCLLRLPRRTAVLLLVGLAVVVRVASLSEKAPLSDDLYRYVWDGQVQLSGVDPYRYPPDAEELAHLRTPYLWPPEKAGTLERTKINRPAVRTIYPPVAEAWFAVERLLLPLDVPDLGYELVGLGLDLAVLAALLALLRRLGRDERWAALYALCPLPVLESVQNAHVDTLGVLLALGAVALSLRRRAVAAAAVLATAVLVKVYPAVLLPLLLRGSWRRLATGVVAFVGVVVASYVPHVAAVGRDVVGYLPGYLQEEKYDEGSRYLLVGLTGLTGQQASLVVAVGLVAAGLWALRTSLPLPDAGLRLFLVVLLLVTPVQPWYGLLLVALAALSGAWWSLPVAAAPYPLYFAAVLDWDTLVVGRWSFGVAAVLMVVLWVASRQTPSWSSAEAHAQEGSAGSAPTTSSRVSRSRSVLAAKKRNTSS